MNQEDLVYSVLGLDLELDQNKILYKIESYVKILDPIENQKLKDNDIDIKSSDRDRKGRNKRGHRVRISPLLGERFTANTCFNIRSKCSKDTWFNGRYEQ
jgi:hypothetical protein